MPRTLNFSKDEILQVAYHILIEEGMKNITARNIAKKLGSSTISIYSNFKSMADLKNEMSRLAKNKLFDITKKEYTDQGLLNIGIGICIFAKQEKALFRSIFLREDLSKDFIDEIITDLKNLIIANFRADERYNHLSDEVIEWMLKKGWWYVQGYASLICSGFYNPTYDDILKELRDMGSVIVYTGLELMTKTADTERAEL